MEWLQNNGIGSSQRDWIFFEVHQERPPQLEKRSGNNCNSR